MYFNLGLIVLILNRVNKEEAREVILMDGKSGLGYMDLIKARIDLFIGNRDDIIHEPLMEERLFDIYVFTGIIIATIVMTLCRSFLFFSVGT